MGGWEPVSTLTVSVGECAGTGGRLGGLHNGDVLCSTIWRRGGMGVQCQAAGGEGVNSYVTCTSQGIRRGVDIGEN